MANSHISGGLISYSGTIYTPHLSYAAMSTSGGKIRGSLGYFTTKLTTATLKATTVSAPTVNATTVIKGATGNISTKMSAASYNIRFFAFENPTARTSCTCTGLDAGDIILSLPTYVKFSAGGLITTGVATSAKVKATNVASVAGLVSNCMVFIAWAKY